MGPLGTVKGRSDRGGQALISSAMVALAWVVINGPSDQAEGAGRVLAQSVLDALGAEASGHPS